LLIYFVCLWRARGDLNPRSPAPKASALIHTRLRALSTGLRPKNNEELILNTLIKLKGSGLSKGTLRNISYTLKSLNRAVDITKPEQVKLHIANMKVPNSWKVAQIKHYNYFCVVNNIEWKRPRYRTERKIPIIPTCAIGDVIGDAELALRTSRIRVDLHGEALRNEIKQMVKVRIYKLKAAQP
jgi:hypothetical protein